MASALALFTGSALTLAAVVVLYFALFHDRARGRLRCPCCWYDMTSLVSPRCPECGYRARRPSQLKTTRRQWWWFAAGLFLLILGQGTLIPILVFKGLSSVGMKSPFYSKKLGNNHNVLIHRGQSCVIVNRGGVWIVPDGSTSGARFSIHDPCITRIGLDPPLAIGRLETRAGGPAGTCWFVFDASSGQLGYFIDEASAAQHWRTLRNAEPPTMLHPDAHAW